MASVFAGLAGPFSAAGGPGEALERYTTGLLSELPSQDGDTIAQALPGTSAQPLQEFRTKMQWDEEDLNQQLMRKMIAEGTTDHGVFVVEAAGCRKQGTASMGVARQYSGTLGKVGHRQVAVTCCYTDPQATWPVAVRLYLRQTWAQDPARRQQARVPAEVAFQTKIEQVHEKATGELGWDQYQGRL